MQASGGFIKQKQRSARAVSGCGQMPRQLQALRFATRQRGHRLPQPQIFEAYFRQRSQRRTDLGFRSEERQCLAHRHIEHVGDRLAFDGDFQNFRAITASVAIGAAQIHIRQKLHLHMLKAVAATRRAATVTGIETEGTRGILALARLWRFGVDVAYGIKRAHIARRVRACGTPDRRLIYHHHCAHVFMPLQCTMRSWCFGGLSFGFEQRGIQHVLHQGGFAGTRNTGNAHQMAQRNFNVNVLQIVFAGTTQLQHGFSRHRCRAAHAAIRAQCAGEVTPGSGRL